jgi:chromosome segregation ATPase
MALAGRKAQRHGWQHQAEQLALNHTAGATAAWAAAKQTRSRPSIEPVSCHFSLAGAKSECDQEASEISGDAKYIEQQLAREAAAAWILNARRETLAARAARAKAADERIIDLEAKLDAVLARIAFQDNENRSLQTSLDLTAGENLRLSGHLSESNAKVEEISSQLEQVRMREAERDRLASAADEKIELLQNLLQVKERRVQKLKQAHSKLFDGTRKLLKTSAERDRALARAEERISSLTELFTQLESKVDLAASKEEIMERHSQLQYEQMERSAAAGADKRARPRVNLWRRELDCDEWLLGRSRG